MMPGLVGVAAIAAVMFAGASAAAQPRTYENPTGDGCLARVYGTSTLHEWTAQSRTMRGELTLPDATFEEGQIQPGPVAAQMTLTVPALSLRSIKADGTPYSSGMDKEMHSRLRASRHPDITFALTSLSFRKRDDAGALLFDCTGDMTVAGVTRSISFPVRVTPGKDSARVRGQMGTRMTDFKISPPRNMLVLRTGDAVRVEFEWTGKARRADAGH